MLSNKSILTKKYLFPAVIAALVFLGLSSQGVAQNNLKINRIKNIRFAPHPFYTRLIFDLDQNVHYKIIPDFKNGVVSLIFDNSAIYTKLLKKNISDKRIMGIKMKELATGGVRFDIKLIFTKNSFFHMPVENPPRLVFDIKNKTQLKFKKLDLEMVKTKGKEPPKPVEGKKLPLEPEKTEAEKIAEMEKKTREKAVENNIEKLKKESEIILAKRKVEGRKEYFEALKIFQSNDYLMAKGLFNTFIKNYPKSKFREDAIFLKAESGYKILDKDPQASHKPVMQTYKLALSQYPHSRHRDMVLYKIGKIYNKMGLNMESKAHFNIIIEDYPDGRFALRARLSRAQILMGEEKYEFAYKELLKVIKKAPSSAEARDATFQIGKFYFNNGNYERAIKIYEDSLKKWPSYAQFHPEVMHEIGEIYFMLGNGEKAQAQLFQLVNLYPNHELAPKSLNRIGEIYRMAQNNEASAKVFHEASIRKPDSEEADYSLIRIADLGIVNPSMRFNNMIFNYDSFYNPIKTYRDIAKRHPQTTLAQSAMLREGIALAKEKSYTAAINKYKQILTTFPDTAIQEDLYALIRESFYNLVDTYYDQKGYLPILATYHNNLSPFLKEIDNPLVLLRIGESYQAVGLNDLAITNYQKVKIKDKKGTFRQVLNINMARIYFAQKDYKKAEEITRKIIRQSKKSAHIRIAMQILADSLYNQGNYVQAEKAFINLMKRFPKVRNNTKNIYFLANAYYRQKKYKNALKQYKLSLKIYITSKGKKQSPGHIADSYFKIGECYYKLKNYSKTIEAYQKAIKMNPNYKGVSLAQFLMAKSYNVLDQSNKALVELKNILEKTVIEIFDKVARTEINLIGLENKYKEILKQ